MVSATGWRSVARSGTMVFLRRCGDWRAGTMVFLRRRVMAGGDDVVSAAWWRSVARVGTMVFLCRWAIDGGWREGAMVSLRRRVIGRRGRFDIRRWWVIGLMARGDRRLLVEAVAALVWATVILRPLRGERNEIGRQSPLEDQGLPGWSRECRREALGAVARGRQNDVGVVGLYSSPDVR